MDFYLMTRLLREQIKKKGEQDKKKNSIIYVGNNHAMKYVQLLRDMEFHLVFSSDTGEPKSCLDVSEMLWPYV